MNVSMFSTFTNIPPGGVRGPDAGSDAYVNLYEHPLLVKDIVFDWDWTVPNRGVLQTYGTPLGDTIRASIKYGNHPLTSGFVPVNLLGRMENARANTPHIGQTAGVSIHSTFTWRFPVPLWLPPNVPLSITMQHQNDFAVDSVSASQTVDVTVRGEIDETDEIPDAVDVPYAASFLTPVQSTSSGGKTGVAPPVTTQTGQTDLFNPFEQPLNVERFAYEICQSSSGLDNAGAVRADFAPTDSLSAQDQSGRLVVGQNYGLDRRYVTMKMVSGKGRALVRTFVPIGVVCGPTRSWELHAVLSPGDYYTAFVTQQMPLFTDPGPLVFQMRTGLAIVGTRCLTLAEAIKTY